jgi:hypothetical protein
VRDAVQERCLLAGAQGKLSAHSPRGPRDGSRQNMSLPETMAMTGHQSVAILTGYFRAEGAPGSKEPDAR